MAEPVTSTSIVPAAEPPALAAIRSDLERAEAARLGNRLHEADGIALDILARAPGLAEALAVRGFVAAARDEVDRAVLLMEAATAKRAEPSWLALLCNLYRRRFRLDAALAAGLAAVSRSAGQARLEPLLELARLRIDRDEPEDAAECFLAILALDPDNAGAHMGLGQVLLADGEFAPGWIEYEWRNRLPEAQGRVPPINAAAWNGMVLPRGRLLVVCDQGFGDAIQFARYLPLAAAKVKELVLVCSPELETLFARVPGVARCCHRWADIPGFSAHALISSLPGLLRTEIDSIPAVIPYLTADPQRTLRWRGEFERKAAGRRRIGLFWSGRATHPNNARRSLPLDALGPVLEAIGDAYVVSLQKELSKADATALAARGIIDLSPHLDSFDDTAAIIGQLDLLVTVDSAVAHLAGSLGRPVSVLTPSPADWRWQRGRSDSPWYPSMRLFRQPTPGDWDGAITQLAASLASA